MSVLTLNIYGAISAFRRNESSYEHIGNYMDPNLKVVVFDCPAGKVPVAVTDVGSPTQLPKTFTTLEGCLDKLVELEPDQMESKLKGRETINTAWSHKAHISVMTKVQRVTPTVNEYRNATIQYEDVVDG